MKKTLTLATILLALTASAGWSQKLTDEPGYIPLEQLDLFPRDKLSVEINIDGALMRLIAAGAKGEDPEFSSLIAGLKAINVQAVPLKNVDQSSVRAKIGRTVHWLEDHGWKSTLRARSEGQETYIYLKEIDGKIAGLTLLAFEPGDEAVVINIVGRLDPDQIGRIVQHLPNVRVNKVPSPGKKPE